jgi:hypothetical protein
MLRVASSARDESEVPFLLNNQSKYKNMVVGREREREREREKDVSKQRIILNGISAIMRLT